MELSALPPPAPRIAWSKAQQAFVVVDSATESASPRVKPPSRLVTTRARLQKRFQTDLEEFASFGEDGEVEDIERFITAREELLDWILDEAEASTSSSSSSSSSPSPLLLLPTFVANWHRGLKRTAVAAENPASTMHVCREFHRLAEAAIQLGDAVLARAALGRCIQLARAHHDDPNSLVALRDAKKLLLQCVQFQHELSLCATGLSRQNVPPLIVHSVLDRLTGLQRLAPLAAEVMVLRVHALLSSHRSKEVVGLLTPFAFTSTSAPLTLAFATALEYEGFYQQSIAVATRFRTVAQPEAASETSDVLALHASHLTALLAHKAAGDDALTQSQYDEAEHEFTAALWMVKPQSRRLRAALLLGKANALLGLERLLSARSDLAESVRLDPTNQIARMRLRTVELSQETQRIHRRMAQP